MDINHANSSSGCFFRLVWRAAVGIKLAQMKLQYPTIL